MAPQASKKCDLLPPDSPAYRLLHEQRPQFGTDAWPLFRTHDLIALSTGISTKRETVPDTVSIPHHAFHPGRSLLLAVISLLFSLPLSHAQVTQTPGAGGLNTQVSQVGNVYEITGGTTAGSNLFHSFDAFSVGAVETARFQTINLVPDATVGNVLGRVTGGTSSNILGAINSATYYPNANLFLMNPAGFLFGPNATVNVGGMVSFTSADYLKLTNDARFNAIPNAAADALISASPVAAFGFLGSNPSAITVQGSRFTVSEGQGISLVGGDIEVTAGTLDDGTTVQPARLAARGGQINLASVTSPGEVLATSFLPEAGMTRGTINVSQVSTVDVSGDAAGTIRIRAGQFELVNSALNADTGNSPGAQTAIDIHLTGNLLISSDSDPALTARSFGDGSAGEISATSAKMETVSTLPEVVSLIDTHTEGAGNGGNVTLKTGEITVMGNPGGFDFFIMSGTAGGGNGGNVTVHADTAHLQEARIDTGDAILGGGGSGGHVTFTGGDMTFDFVSIVTDSLNARGGNLLLDGRDITITNDSSIGPLSLLGESTLTINARDFALLDGSDLFNQTALGTGGGTTLTVRNAEFTNGSSVLSQTSGDADSGFIKLFATGDVTFADTFDTFNSGFLNPSGLFTNSLGDVNLGTDGNAGPIDVTARLLTMTGGTRFDSTTRTDGNGGTITVTTTDGISISGERPFRIVSDIFGLGNSRASGIYSQTVGNELCSGTCGNAGGILVTTGDFQLAQGGAINVGTSSTGHGGAATVVATNGISISGAMLDGTPSGIFSRTVGTVLESGEGGNIALTARQSVAISNGASVSASSTGPGNTGNIEINAGNQFAMTNSSVTTEANLASGGTIKITTTPSGTVQLTNSTISASVLDGTGGGGSVNIDPQFVILQNSQILAQATQGPGGNISITTNLLLPDAYSTISASSQFGVNGTVTIQSPNAPASGKIQPLGKTPLQATSLLTQRCAALAGGEFSSFTVAGRNSLPTEPGSWLASPLASLSAGMGLGMKAEGVKAEGERPDIPILSLRQIAPAGFLTQSFAVDWSAGCQS
jgi:filamentous hemagglutinin family protein